MARKRHEAGTDPRVIRRANRQNELRDKLNGAATVVAIQQIDAELALLAQEAALVGSDTGAPRLDLIGDGTPPAALPAPDFRNVPTARGNGAANAQRLAGERQESKPHLHLQAIAARAGILKIRMDLNFRKLNKLLPDLKSVELKDEDGTPKGRMVSVYLPDNGRFPGVPEVVDVETDAADD